VSDIIKIERAKSAVYPYLVEKNAELYS